MAASSKRFFFCITSSCLSRLYIVFFSRSIETTTSLYSSFYCFFYALLPWRPLNRTEAWLNAVAGQIPNGFSQAPIGNDQQSASGRRVTPVIPVQLQAQNASVSRLDRNSSAPLRSGSSALAYCAIAALHHRLPSIVAVETRNSKPFSRLALVCRVFPWASVPQLGRRCLFSFAAAGPASSLAL